VRGWSISWRYRETHQKVCHFLDVRNKRHARDGCSLFYLVAEVCNPRTQIFSAREKGKEHGEKMGKIKELEPRHDSWEYRNIKRYVRWTRVRSSLSEMRFSFLLWKQDGIEALLAFLQTFAFISRARLLVPFIKSRDIVANFFYSSISQFVIYNAAVLRALRFDILGSTLFVSGLFRNDADRIDPGSIM